MPKARSGGKQRANIEPLANYEEVYIEPEEVDSEPGKVETEAEEVDSGPEEVDFEQDIPIATYQVTRSRGLLALTVIWLAAIASVVAWFTLGRLQPTWAVGATRYFENSPIFGSWISGPPIGHTTAGAPSEEAKPPAAELIIGKGTSGGAGEALPLGVSLNNGPVDARIIVDGLAAGSTLNKGRPLGARDWQLMADELPDAVVRPPQGFTGAMELGLELRLTDDSVADRKSLHLEWAAPVEEPTTRPTLVVRHLDPYEVAALVKRGQSFIASGDLASARLVLQRAAEAGEAQAALSLAGTYDPIALKGLGFEGPKADIGKARTWYQRAQELGSTAASGRLQLLAGYDQ